MTNSIFVSTWTELRCLNWLRVAHKSCIRDTMWSWLKYAYTYKLWKWKQCKRPDDNWNIGRHASIGMWMTSTQNCLPLYIYIVSTFVSNRWLWWSNHAKYNTKRIRTVIVGHWSINKCCVTLAETFRKWNVLVSVCVCVQRKRVSLFFFSHCPDCTAMHPTDADYSFDIDRILKLAAKWCALAGHKALAINGNRRSDHRAIEFSFSFQLIQTTNRVERVTRLASSVMWTNHSLSFGIDIPLEIIEYGVWVCVCVYICIAPNLTIGAQVCRPNVHQTERTECGILFCKCYIMHMNDKSVMP